MTGKELIKLIQDDKVEDFDILFRYSTTDEKGINLHTFDLDPVFLDIGYSERIAILTGDCD